MWQFRGFAIAFWLLSHAAPAGLGAVRVTVSDSSHQPIAHANVQLKAGPRVVASAETGPDGVAGFSAIPPATYDISAAKDGFETAAKNGIVVAPDSSTTVQLTLLPAARHESVEVAGAASPVGQGSSAPTTLPVQTVKGLPSRPATVADALPLVPGVVRGPDGAIQISASPEHRSALIVNSADVTDPATGQFGLTVPIDSVETVTVYQTPFVAEYGRFTAGLVAVETRRGGDRWKWELNDPFPDFYIRSYHLRGLRDATPRINFEGPLLPRRLYISEGFEYDVRKIEIHTLPFPNDQKKQAGFNSFTQLDWVVSDKHLLTLTAHIAPQRLVNVNLDYFNPPATTPQADTHNYTETLSDKLTLLGGLLENTISLTRFDARVWGLGGGDLIMTPQGNGGSYFEQRNRTASRLGWAPIYAFAPLKKFGTHEFKIGSYLAASSNHGQVNDNPIDILDSSFRLLEQITYFGGRGFQSGDTDFAAFAQDHWTLASRLAFDWGVRTESQQVSESIRVAPRAGIAWTPLAGSGLVIRAGFGIFYDRVPLNVYSFNHYPRQIVTIFDAGGQISAGPFFYENALGVVTLNRRLVFNGTGAGNFSPESGTGSVQVEAPLSRRVKLRAGYLQNQSAGLVILDVLPPDPVTNFGAHQLSGAGQSRYRQLEITTRVKLSDTRYLTFSYVRSRGRGDLNDFGSYLSSFPTPIVRPNQYGTLPADLPNRFVAWGQIQLPEGFRIAPVFEYRNGFPYITTTAAQDYAGVPNQNRYPNFLSLDSRLSRDFKVSQKYSIELSVTDFNLTNHFNPEAFHNNIADPAFGLFFGSRGRRFTADFDVLF